MKEIASSTSVSVILVFNFTSEEDTCNVPDFTGKTTLILLVTPSLIRTSVWQLAFSL